MGARRTLVAMSGGVDSSTVAALLVEAGDDVVGVFMRNGVTGSEGSRSCCSLSDARDARAVADRLGIPFYAHDLSRPFAKLIDAFAADYAAGRTPNPCVVCNNDLKFGALADLADDLGCDGVATGHYARLVNGALLRGLDATKDQSYLLAGLTTEQLGRARFPIGGLTKAAVRATARRFDLPVAEKRDSADICFVPGGNYRQVVADRLGNLGRPGVVTDGEGQTLAEHGGIGGFTVGQRRGLGVAVGRPAFVTAIDSQTGQVRIGDRMDLSRAMARIEDVNWLVSIEDGQRVEAQLRHHHTPEPATVRLDGETVLLRFLRPSLDVTPGQYAVLYRGDRVLAAGRLMDDEA